MPLFINADGQRRPAKIVHRRPARHLNKHLPAVRYQAALDWLAGWYAELAGGPASS